MNSVKFPYGKDFLEYDFSTENFLGTLTSSLHAYTPKAGADALVAEAMANPTGSKTLKELARGKKNVVIIASDHTRPVPSKVIIPPMLKEIREGNPDAQITILIATGCHRYTTHDELVAKFGEKTVNEEKIVVHVSTEDENMVRIGTLPSGGALLINRIAAEADLLVAEGFIEPHFFAGFSGGRKSVLPGVSAKETVLANHCAEFIAHPKARTGVIDGNPIHEDMLFAAKCAKLAYVVNVVINEKKEAIFAVAGDVEAAHRAGCDFLSKLCRTEPKWADVVISTNGGYPLDQNVYQSVKGMTAAEASVKEGGVIIMISSCSDGHGGEEFFRQMSLDTAATEKEILSRGRGETLPDQWMTQILIRILNRASVILISEAPDEMIEKMHMIPAHSLEDAMKKAKAVLKNENPTVTAIPDGVAVMVVENK